MDCKGNIYWASFRSACYAAIVLFSASKINGCYTSHCVNEHNCSVKWTDTAKELSKNYQTNVVVRKIRIGDRGYPDFNGTKLLLHKEAEMKFGSDRYILKMKEYEPSCEKHGGSARIYYTVEPKKED